VEEGAGGVLAVSPASAEEAREVVLAARGLGWGVVPAGAGAWLDAGHALRSPRVELKTTRMARLVEHEPADLVATVEAGARLSEFNRVVGGAGQWLALDPPGGASATVGGAAATGLAGPLGLSYGAPRAHILGMKVLLADGRVVRVGGRVVKNVAGYDLCKLFAGSYGTLGVLLELTFKLRPLPARDATLVVLSRDRPKLYEAARAVVAAHLRPAAAELVSPGLSHALDLAPLEPHFGLLLRFKGTGAAVDYQLGEARGAVRERGLEAETLPAGTPAWSRLADYAAGARGGLVWRAGVLPARLGELLTEVEGRHENFKELPWHAGAGDGRVRVFDDEGASTSIESLRRAARDLGGSLVVERAPAELKARLDPWGLSDASASLMRRVKQQLDPDDIFSPGRFLN
jgi:FAD/FMN-containing dehydrogenase